MTITTINCAFAYTGIRSCDELFQIGDIVPNSRAWEDNECTDEELNGASATEIVDGDRTEAERIHAREGYTAIYDHTYIIASNSMEYGQDAREIILSNAVVLEVIR